MHTPSFHIIVDSTNQIYGGTYNLCEMREYTFRIFPEYTIIFPSRGVMLQLQIFLQIVDIVNILQIFM